jgi:hypothetical protein
MQAATGRNFLDRAEGASSGAGNEKDVWLK